MEFDDILEEMKGVDKVAKVKTEVNKARDIYIDRTTRGYGLTDEEAREYLALDRLCRLAEGMLSDLEQQAIFLIPEATQLDYYREKTRLHNLRIQYFNKQGVILENRKAQIKGGK